MDLKKTVKNSAMLIAAALCVGASTVKAAAKDFSDTKNHWAKAHISQAVSKGYVSGYADGSFKPNSPVTRAEFVKMINNAVGVKTSGDISFSDVRSSDWYYGEVKKAVSAGYISGYSDNTFAANKYVTRQEAAVIISRIATNPEKTRSITALADYSSVPEWSKTAVEAVFSKGYMTGDTKGKFNPNARLTRAEAVKIINMILAEEKIVSSNVTISQSNFTYDGRICTGDVTIDENTPAGNVYLDGCTVLGTLNISCRNGNKIVLNNTSVSTINLTSGSSSVTLSLTGNSSAAKVNVMRPAILRTEQSVKNGGFSEVNLDGSYLDGQTVGLWANVPNVNVMRSVKLELMSDVTNMYVKKSGVNLTVSGGDIANLIVDKAATGSKITLQSGVNVESADIRAKVAFKGNAKIKRAVESAEGITYETQPVSLQKYGSGSTSNIAASFKPSSGTLGVSVYESININFAQAVYKPGGSKLTASYIENGAVELRKGSTSGTQIKFSAEISSDKKKITITPSKSLDAGSGYYVILKDDMFASASGSTNAGQTAYFKTAENGNLTPEITPDSGKTGVPTDTDITIKFDSKIYKKSGADINAGYIEKSVVELRRGSASGTLVSTSASINSAKTTITVSPEKELQSKTTYYVIIRASSIADEDGNYNAKTVSKFTTAAAVKTSPENDETGVSIDSSISITFGSEVCKPDGGTLKSDYLKEKIKLTHYYLNSEFTVSVSSGSKVITIRPKSRLEANSTYSVLIPAGTLAYEDEDYGQIGAISFKFKTEDGKSKISYFDVEKVGMDSATAAIRANSEGTAYFTLKPASGTAIKKEVSVSKNSEKSVLFDGLTQNTKYTLSVYVKNVAGNTSETESRTFTTEQPKLDISASNIDFTSARIKIAYNTAGTLNVSYGKKGGSSFEEVVTNAEASGSGSTTATLSELISGQEYTVKAELKLADSGEVITQSFDFMTDHIMTDPTLAKVKVNVGGMNYTAEKTGDDKFEAAVTADIGDVLKITPEANGGSRATVTVNGEKVKSGSQSSGITIERYGDITIEITVKAEDDSQMTYTMTVSVSEK